jgi:hypothetical protein
LNDGGDLKKQTMHGQDCLHHYYNNNMITRVPVGVLYCILYYSLYIKEASSREPLTRAAPAGLKKGEKKAKIYIYGWDMTHGCVERSLNITTVVTTPVGPSNIAYTKIFVCSVISVSGT